MRNKHSRGLGGVYAGTLSHLRPHCRGEIESVNYRRSDAVNAWLALIVNNATAHLHSSAVLPLRRGLEATIAHAAAPYVNLHGYIRCFAQIDVTRSDDPF